jgi:hypothetical protein
MNKWEIEEALDHGRLWAAMRNNRWWKLRRNGRTQTWKTRPSEFRIPVKAGLKSYADVTHGSLVAYHSADDWSACHFVICAAGVDPNITPGALANAI